MTGFALRRPGVSKELRAFLAATLAGLAGWGLFAAWTPAGGREASICLLRRVLLPCPGCGMTRAVAHLAKGEWQAAWVAHPLVFLLTVEALMLWGWLGARVGRGGLYPSPRRGFWLWAVSHGVLFLAVWIYRLSTGQLPW